MDGREYLRSMLDLKHVIHVESRSISKLSYLAHRIVPHGIVNNGRCLGITEVEDTMLFK